MNMNHSIANNQELIRLRQKWGLRKTNQFHLNHSRCQALLKFRVTLDRPSIYQMEVIIKISIVITQVPLTNYKILWKNKLGRITQGMALIKLW